MRGRLDPCDRGFGPRHLQARPVLARRACAYAGFARVAKSRPTST